MTTKDKIKEVFDFYEIPSGVDSEYGNWVVSEDADVVNVDKMYPIYTHQIKNENLDSWLDHMTEKTWFDDDESSNFQKAYRRAEDIIGK